MKSSLIAIQTVQVAIEGPNSDGSIEGCDSCSGDLYLLDNNCVIDCGKRHINQKKK